jgi:hypothetical protein
MSSDASSRTGDLWVSRRSVQGATIPRRDSLPGRPHGLQVPGERLKPAKLQMNWARARGTSILRGVTASLKWATAKVERTSQRGNGERTQGRERQAERGGDFNDPAPTY